MTAASASQEETKDVLDEILGEAPEDHPDDSATLDVGESKDDKPDTKEPEPEPEPIAADAESDDEAEEEPGNLRLPEKDEAGESDGEPSEAEPEAELSDDAKRLAAEKKRTAGLEKALVGLRKRNAEMNAQRAPQQAPPVPAAPPVQAAPDPAAAASADGRIGVVVSEDGQNVYVDEAKLAERMQATAASAYAEAMKPTPEQISAENERQMAHSFISQNPERNQAIYQNAHQAENFIFEAVSTGARNQGVVLDSVPKIQEFIRQTGIGEQVKEFFPDVAPLIDEFVAAGVSDNPMWKRSVLERMGPSVMDDEPVTGASGALEAVGAAPRSLARKGATRSQSTNTDELEFSKLEKEFQGNMFDMPEKKVQRMEALGKKLGITGME